MNITQGAKAMAKVIVGSGFVAQSPHAGGVFSVVLQYLLGLRRLGCEVCWLELLWPEGADDRPLIRRFMRQLAAFGLERDVCLIYFPEGTWPEAGRAREWYGWSPARFWQFCAEADLLLDLCASVRPPDLLAAVRRTAFLDLDPGFMQLWIELGTIRPSHDLFFTVGQHIGRPGCPIPSGGRAWQPFWPPVDVELWQDGMSAVEAPFSTVSQWWGYPTTVYAGEEYDGSKRSEFLRVVDLPALTGESFELALDLAAMGDGDDRQLLREKGWHVVDARQEVGDFASYRCYVHRARAEFSVAKPGYVKTRSGWFSDRSACYLAAGRPVVVQETGFSAFLPTGRGVLSFTTVEEAVQGITTIREQYAVHSRAAREIAREYFAAEKVLGQLLAEAGV
jgi:hypothetical protein